MAVRGSKKKKEGKWTSQRQDQKNIGEQWRKIRAETGCQTDADLAILLLK